MQQSTGPGSQRTQARVIVPTATAVKDPLLGRIYHSELYKYLLIDKIGEGGMGIVYKALVSPKNADDAFKNCPVLAVKLLNTMLASEGAAERFRHEARAMEKLNKYPNMVMVRDLGNDTQQYPSMFLAMDYLEGRSVGQELAKIGRIPWPRTVNILSQTFDILICAHGEEIVHRDMKPDNIFLLKVLEKQPDKVRVLDFGTAKLFGPTKYTTLTIKGNIVGTIEFMPPEQLNNPGGEENDFARLVTRETYSLGALAYYLLAGVPPFLGSDIYSLIAQITNTAPRPLSERLPGIPPELDHFIARALSKSPADRFQYVVEMKQALQKIEWDGKPVFPQAIRGYTPKPAKRRFIRPLIEAFGAVVLLVGVGGGAWFAANHPDRVRSLWNNKACPLLEKFNIHASKIAVSDANYLTTVVSDPPGAKVYEQFYVNGELRKKYIGNTPLSCGFTGVHNLLIQKGSAIKPATVSSENHDVTVIFTKPGVRKQYVAPSPTPREEPIPQQEAASPDTQSVPPDIPEPAPGFDSQ